MARFVYEEGDYGYVTLEAKPGEEIPVEMAAAWAAIRHANALRYFGDQLLGLENALGSIAHAITDK